MIKNPLILIVEDDTFNYDLLAVILAGIDAQLLWAQSGDLAMPLFEQNKVDLVLMDLKLPGKSGYELSGEFKTLKPEVPIIAQTAYALIGDREKALSAGCDDYIAKPIRRQKLLDKIASLLD